MSVIFKFHWTAFKSVNFKFSRLKWIHCHRELLCSTDEIQLFNSFTLRFQFDYQPQTDENILHGGCEEHAAS